MKTSGNGKTKRRAKSASPLDKAIDAVMSAGTSFSEMVKGTVAPAKTRSPRKRRQAAV